MNLNEKIDNEKEIEEYNFQELYLEKADMTDFKEASELFHTDKVMTYDEYVQFCVEWNLEQVYDKEGKYAIHAKMYDGVRSTDMDKVIQKGKHIDAIAICYGAVNTEYITIDFLVIPVNNKIKTIEDLKSFAKNNYEEYQNLMGKRENLWKRYHRAKTEDGKSEILAEINSIQPTIKKFRKYDNFCKEIKKRSESIQNNLNNFDKDIQKEKDNSRII